MALHLIGLWRNEQHPDYPDPHDFKDAGWDEDKRHVVAGYLDAGTYLRGYMGLSPCRICGQSNGSGEYTDGTLVWPEGLAHYVRDHFVRLPASIEKHILGRLVRLEAEDVSVGWWAAGSPDPIP